MAPRTRFRRRDCGGTAPVAWHGLLAGLLLLLSLLACPDGSTALDERAFRIERGGRLVLAAHDLAGRETVVFHLTLEDSGSAASRTARVVARDGRRVDTRIERVPGAAHTFRLEVDSGFLRTGGYLIEVDGEGAHALNLRRYVVEIVDGSAAM